MADLNESLLGEGYTDIQKATARRQIERREYFKNVLRVADPSIVSELVTTWKELE